MQELHSVINGLFTPFEDAKTVKLHTQKTCLYGEQSYVARNDGSVFRITPPGKKPRKHDGHWTFGQLNRAGYLTIGAHPVHRIVATAFHGPSPSEQHVVDHIDTNRQNNRPENLRWVTRLENILSNPITVKKIAYHCGSIEAFLADPSLLKDCVAANPNFGWMRAVSPEEAMLSWQRLSGWAAKPNSVNQTTSLRDHHWPLDQLSLKESLTVEAPVKQSLTPNALQTGGKQLFTFRLCPQERSENLLRDYYARLRPGLTFASVSYASYLIVDATLAADSETFWVRLQQADASAMKTWSVIQVTLIEEDKFLHKHLGNYFQEMGAQKAMMEAQGLTWEGDEPLDDLC